MDNSIENGQNIIGRCGRVEWGSVERGDYGEET